MNNIARNEIMKYLKTLISLFVLLVLFSPSYSSWLSYQKDPFHSGRTETEGPFTPELKWFYDCGYMIQTSPVINEDGTIFFGTYDVSPLENMQNSLYAIAPGGQSFWSLPLPDRISSTCAIGPSENLFLWSYPTYDSIASSPALSEDGTIFFGTILNGILYALDSNGTLKWSFVSGGEEGGIQSSPCLSTDYGTVYFGNLDGTVYALSTNNGGLKWTRRLGGSVQSSPAIGYLGSVAIGCNDQKIYVLDNVQGNLRLSYQTKGEIVSTPAIGFSGNIYVTSMDGNLYAFTSGGELLWTYSTGYRISSSPIVDGSERIYFGSANKKIYAINQDGTFLWTYNTLNSIEFSSPAIGSDGTLYIGSTDGRLYAIEQGTNQVKLPFTQNSVENKLASYLMMTNTGDSRVDFSINLYDRNGSWIYYDANSISSGHLGIYNLQTLIPDFVGSCSVVWEKGKMVIWSVIFNGEYGTGYPLTANFRSYQPPVYFPYWITSSSYDINTYFMVNNFSSTDNLFLKVNIYDSDGSLGRPMSANIPPRGMSILDVNSFGNQDESGYGFMEWYGKSSVSPFGVVYNLKTNKGFPLDFDAIYSSQVVIPYWKVSPSGGINTLLYVVNPFGVAVNADIILYSFDGKLINSFEISIAPGKQQLVDISEEEGEGWGILSWEGGDQLGVACFLTDQADLTTIPVSCNKIIKGEAYIPFWQVYSALSIDTYFVLTNFDLDTPAVAEINFYNSSGGLLASLDMRDNPLPAGSTVFLSAKSLVAFDNVGYGTISADGNIALWAYAYNGLFDVGYTIDPQYPIGSDNP